MFLAAIAHCEEMARQFNAAKMMAACFTSDTREIERKALLDEYRKPDSALRVLLSVSALAKALMSQDVGCVCDVRPLRKSLSEGYPDVGAQAGSSPGTGLLTITFCSTSAATSSAWPKTTATFSTTAWTRSTPAKTRQDDSSRQRRNRKAKPAQFADTSRWASAAFPVGTGYQLSLVEHEHGEMQKSRISKTKYADDKAPPVEQAYSYARGYSAPDKQQGRAKAIFRDISADGPIVRGTLPPPKRADHSRGAQQNQVMNFIAYAKSIRGARHEDSKISPQRTD